MEDWMVEKNGRQFVDVVKLLPEALPSGKKILWRQVDEKRIEISVDKHSARGGKVNPITILRSIPINELLFEGLGLRLGDGIKLQGGKFNVFGFSNTEIFLHKHFLKFSKECFGLESAQFKARISVPSKLKDEIKEIEENFSKELNVSNDNFSKPQVLEQRKLPFIDIKINSTLLGFIVNKLFNSLIDLILKRKEFSASLLRGIIASDGNIHLRNGKKLDEINIAAHLKEERDFIRNLLLNLDISPNKDKEIFHDEAVLTHGLSNFKLVDKWKLVNLHPNKLKAFEFGINNFTKEEFRKGEAKFLILKSLLEKPKRSLELENEFNRCQQAINWNMNRLEKRNLVERFRNRKNIFWKIKDQGIKFLENKNIQELLENLKHNN